MALRYGGLSVLLTLPGQGRRNGATQADRQGRRGMAPHQQRHLFTTQGGKITKRAQPAVQRCRPGIGLLVNAASSRRCRCGDGARRRTGPATGCTRPRTSDARAAVIGSRLRGLARLPSGRVDSIPRRR